MASLAAAIQASSVAVETEVWTRTGWTPADHPEFAFLHAGGAIGADNVSVELAARANMICLPNPCETPQEAIEASLAILDIGAPATMFPLLATPFRAAVSSLRANPFVIFLYGTSGTYKTSVATLTASHFGDFDDKKTLTSFSSTKHAIAYQLAEATDTFALVDDLVPHERPTDVDTAVWLIRGLANNDNRARLKSDGSYGTTHIVQTLTVMTGEELPPGVSAVGRLITLPFTQGTLDLKPMLQLQNRRYLLQQSMASYLGWLSDMGREAATAYISDCHERARSLEVPTHHTRVIGALQELMTGLLMFLDFAQAHGVLSVDDAADLEAKAFRAFEEVGAQQLAPRDEDPAEAYLDFLRDELTMSEKLLAPFSTALEPEHIGFRSDEGVFVRANTAWKRFVAHCRAMGTSPRLSKSSMHKRLVERNDVVPSNESGRIPWSKGKGKGRCLLFTYDALAITPDSPESPRFQLASNKSRRR